MLPVLLPPSLLRLFPGDRVKTAGQPVEAPGAKVATQPVEASGSRPVVHLKATSASVEEVQATRLVEQSFTCKKILPPVAATVVSVHSDVDSDEDRYSEPSSPPNTLDEEGEL